MLSIILLLFLWRQMCLEPSTSHHNWTKKLWTIICKSKFEKSFADTLMALKKKTLLCLKMNGLTEKRNVIIGYVHWEMVTSIQEDCANLPKAHVSTDSTTNIAGVYWAAFVIAIPYLSADRSQQKILNRELRAETKWTETFGLILTIYMGRMSQ